jgi:hypothetical protein
MGIQRTFRKKPAVPPPQPVPGTEVQETNWAEWEDSIAFQDSGLADPNAVPKKPEAASAPSAKAEPDPQPFIDPFASVTRKGS